MTRHSSKPNKLRNINPVRGRTGNVTIQRLFRLMERKKSLIDSTVQKTIQKRVVEQKEHKSCGNPLHPDLPPDVSTHVLPLGTVRSGRESEVDCAPLPHCNPISSGCHLNLSTRKHLHTQLNHTFTYTLTKDL